MGRLTNLKPRLQTAPARLATIKPDSWRNDKQTSGERGYTYKWQKAREAYLLAHPFCVFCLRAKGITCTDTSEQWEQWSKVAPGMPTMATVLDHAIPHRGDMVLFWDRTNWQGLCATCHSGEKQRQEKACSGS